MKTNIFYLLALLCATTVSTSCSDFLDETPDKSGSAYIYHIDQLYGLMGSPDLYLFADSKYMLWGITGNYLYEQTLMSDAVELTPEFYVKGLNGGTNNIMYDIYSYKCQKLIDESYTMGMTWTASWDRIYRFNTVLENIDKVEQSTETIRNEVEGEARFGRAYYHFLLLTQYCLWGDDAPGLGYRDDTTPDGVPERQTVAYTLSRINDDLDKAEAALTKAGRTRFECERNFRPTVPTVNALRARVALYRGDYTTALAEAQKALAAHSTLVTFKDDQQYQLDPTMTIYLLGENGERRDSLVATTMTKLYYRQADAVPEYEELYVPAVTGLDYAGTTPMSELFYDKFTDKAHDARWIYFFGALDPLNMTIGRLVESDAKGELFISAENQRWLKPSSCHAYLRFSSNGQAGLLGMTTAEMYLVKAECLARAGRTAEAAETLRTLRRTRFLTAEAADNIGGTISEVLDERYREMGTLWRFFDMKRLNGAEHADLHVRRDILTDPSDLSTVTTLDIGPDDPRWALPLNRQEAESMGWKQNEGWQ